MDLDQKARDIVATVRLLKDDKRAAAAVKKILKLMVAKIDRAAP